MKKNLSLVLEQLSNKQKFVLNTIIGFNGVILRPQLLYIMKSFDIDERTCSVIISHLKTEGIIESKVALPNCKAVMLFLTRKANAAILQTEQKNVFSKTDSESNNLRQILKTELIINYIENDYGNYKKQILITNRTKLFLTKNNYQLLYRSLAEKQKGAFIGEWYKASRVKGMINDFNFATMMSRDYYFERIHCEQGYFRYCVIERLAVTPINTAIKINNLYNDIMYIFRMIKSYFRFYFKFKIKIQINIRTFNQEEANYIRKNFKYKKLEKVFAQNKLLFLDEIDINIVSLELDKKYSIRRELV